MISLESISIFAFGGGVITLFWKGDELLSEEARQRLAVLLKEVSFSKLAREWPDRFIEMFDGIFGKKHFTLSCFWRSCVASISIFSILLIIFSAIYKSLAVAMFDNLSNLFDNNGITMEFVIFFAIIISNVFVDFLSLFETRQIIKLISIKPTLIRMTAFIILDLILTIIIYSIILFFTVHIFTALHRGFDVPEFLGYILDLGAWKALPLGIIGFFSIEPNLSVDSEFTLFGSSSLYTTFFTSFWVWIYILSILVVQISFRAEPLVKFFQWALNIDKHPIRVIGVVAAGICVTALGILTTIVKVI